MFNVEDPKSLNVEPLNASDKGARVMPFKDPFYGGAHGAYRALGENETLSIIDECLNVWGTIRITVQDVETVQTDQTPTSLQHSSGHAFLPRDAGEDEGGGVNDLNDLNALNPMKKESDDG